MRPIAVPTLLTALLAAPALEAAEPLGRVLVVPFVPVRGEVDARAAEAVTAYVVGAFSDSVDAVRADAAAAAPPSAPSTLAKRIAEAEALEDARNIEAAIAARQSVVEAIHAGAAGPEAALRLAEALHALARAQMWAGADAAARATLAEAVRVQGDLRPDARAYSRLYRRWVSEAIAEARAAPRGLLTVDASVPGARVELDGRDLGAAPVVAKGVVVGRHLVRVHAPGRPASLAAVDVRATGDNRHVAALGALVGGETVASVAADLRANTLAPKTVEAARAAGRHAAAERVLVAGLVKNDLKIRVRAALVDVGSGHVQVLEPLDLDEGLLTAEADVLRLARAAEAGITKPTPVGAIAKLDRTRALGAVARTVSGAPVLPTRTKSVRTPKKGPKIRVVHTGADDTKIKSDECCECKPG